MEVTLALDQTRVLTAEGREVPVAELAKELAVGRLVVRAREPAMPDAAYLKLLEKDAIVLVPKP